MSKVRKKMCDKVSAIMIAVFLCLNVFAMVPMGVNAAQSDLGLDMSVTRAYVGENCVFGLYVNNDSGIAELDRLKANGVTGTFSATDPSAIKIETVAPTANYPYPYRCKVTFLNIKSTIIYLTLSNGWRFQITAPEVYNFFGDMWFTQKTASVKIGGTVQLNYDYDGDYGPKPITNPECMTYENGARWASSNAAVATVNQSGLVTGIKAGTVKITFTVPKQRVVNNTVTDYVISCDVAVSADGKATVAPTTEKSASSTKKPGTTVKVSQSTTKSSNGSPSRTAGPQETTNLGLATSRNLSEKTSAAANNSQVGILEHSGAKSTSNVNSVGTDVNQLRQPYILAVALLGILLAGIVAGFFMKRKSKIQ